jgi:phosphopantothenoylcysteine synthetase/decarboxylase
MVGANVYSIVPADFDMTHAIDYLFILGVIAYIGVIVFIYMQKIELTKEDLIVNDDEKEYVVSNLVKEDTLLDDDEEVEAHKIDIE